MNADKRWIVTDSRYLRMLAPFICKEETRYYLNGIYIEPAKEGILLVANDGHRLGVINDVNGEASEPFICPISRDSLSKSKKMRCDGGGDVAFIGHQICLFSKTLETKQRKPSAALKLAEYSERLTPIDGTYPDWRRIVPLTAKNRIRPMTFNAAYMADYSNVQKEYNGEARAAVKLFQSGGTPDPVIIRLLGIPEFFAVHMPMRDDSRIEALPDWLNLEKPKTKTNAKRKAPAKPKRKPTRRKKAA